MHLGMLPAVEPLLVGFVVLCIKVVVGLVVLFGNFLMAGTVTAIAIAPVAVLLATVAARSDAY